MKNNSSIQYDYIVRNISENPHDPAYEAYIPAFHAIVFGDNHKELEEGIVFSIESEIEERTKAGKPIPAPDIKKKFSGKLVLRIPPALHERLAIEAKALGESLNSLLGKKLLRV